jgi:thiol-disulfide isomerase/thioredoxin
MTTTELPPEDRPPVTPPRRVSRGLLVAAALATVVLAIATVMAFRPADDDVETLLPPDQVAEGAYAPPDLGPAPDVAGDPLPALDYTAFGDGAEVPLTTGGRPLLVNFWASTCAPCVEEMPAIQAVADANAADLGVLGLQVAEGAERGEAMLQRTGVTYPVGRDPDGSIIAALGGVALPTTVLVTAEGTIAHVHQGALDADQLQGLVDEHLG